MATARSSILFKNLSAAAFNQSNAAGLKSRKIFGLRIFLFFNVNWLEYYVEGGSGCKLLKTANCLRLPIWLSSPDNKDSDKTNKPYYPNFFSMLLFKISNQTTLIKVYLPKKGLSYNITTKKIRIKTFELDWKYRVPSHIWCFIISYILLSNS